MEAKLNKIKHNFVKIKDIRLAVMNIFSTLEVKFQVKDSKFNLLSKISTKKLQFSCF